MKKVFAQEIELPDGTRIQGPLRSEISNVGDIINAVMPYIFAIAGMALLVMLLSAGFSFLTSAGDPKNTGCQLVSRSQRDLAVLGRFSGLSPHRSGEYGLRPAGGLAACR